MGPVCRQCPSQALAPSEKGQQRMNGRKSASQRYSNIIHGVWVSRRNVCGCVVRVRVTDDRSLYVPYQALRRRLSTTTAATAVTTATGACGHIVRRCHRHCRLLLQHDCAAEWCRQLVADVQRANANAGSDCRQPALLLLLLRSRRNLAPLLTALSLLL